MIQKFYWRTRRNEFGSNCILIKTIPKYHDIAVKPDAVTSMRPEILRAVMTAMYGIHLVESDCNMVFPTQAH